MVAAPVVTPVTPPDTLTEATAPLLLVQIPPGTTWVRVMVWPTQTLVPPPILAGEGATLETIVDLQPVPKV